MKQTFVQAGVAGVGALFAEVWQSPRRPMIAGAFSGVVSGIAFGAFTGPVGALLGMWLGLGVGVVTGYVLAHEDAVESVRTKELDAIIGITKGSMGAGAIAMTVKSAIDDEEEDPPPYSTKEAWISEWLTPPPPCVG